jgi:hypothetical protein
MTAQRLALFMIASLFIIAIPCSYAADTVETYDQGAVDFEFYLGGDALNQPKYEKTLFGNLLVGYGLLPGFSGYFTLDAESDDSLLNGESGYSFGIFGTPLDTDHFDLDLLLDVGMGGEAVGDISVTPGLEFNFDLKPDMELWGLYVRVEDGISGRDESVEDDPSTPNVNEEKTKTKVVQSLGYTGGTYFTIAGRHQILAEYYHAQNMNPAPDELRWDSGGFALGYNVGLVDNLELVTQVNAHPGHNHQDATWGAYVGFIATIPGASSKPDPQQEH